MHLFALVDTNDVVVEYDMIVCRSSHPSFPVLFQLTVIVLIDRLQPTDIIMGMGYNVNI